MLYQESRQNYKESHISHLNDLSLCRFSTVFSAKSDDQPFSGDFASFSAIRLPSRSWLAYENGPRVLFRMQLGDHLEYQVQSAERYHLGEFDIGHRLARVGRLVHVGLILSF